MTSSMKCVPARSMAASFWKLREQTQGNYPDARQRQNDKVQAVEITSAERYRQGNATAEVTSGRLQELLRFGGLMLSAGETAFRVRRSMSAIARDLGFE